MAMTFVFSNNVKAQLGVRAGFNMYNVITKDANGNEEYNDPKLNPGFHAGITYDFPIARNFYVQSAALFTTKGYKIKRITTTSSVESYINPYFVEVPVNLLFAPKLGKGRLMLGAGPYVAYGIGGKGKYFGKTIVNNVLVEDNQAANIQFVDDFSKAAANKWTFSKPLDYGVQFIEGYEFKERLSLQLIGQLGLANTKPKNNGAVPTTKLKNYGVSLSIGYIF